MPPSNTAWDDEESDSTPPSSPSAVATRRGKFEDEEDGDVLESWDAAEDSEAEREKAKKAAAAKAKAEAEAKANHKSRAQRVEEKREKRRKQRDEEDEGEESSEEEDEADRRARMRAAEQASDLQNAEELFGGVGGVPDSRSAAKRVTVQEGEDPSAAIDLSSLKLFNPVTVQGFNKLRDTLVPLLNQNGKKAQYESFMKEFTKQIVRDLNSEQVKKLASGLTAISNEKLKEEKAAEKGGKKSKAAKTKSTLNAGRNVAREADTAAYDDGLDEDDFM